MKRKRAPLVAKQKTKYKIQKKIYYTTQLNIIYLLIFFYYYYIYIKHLYLLYYYYTLATIMLDASGIVIIDANPI